MIDLTKPVAVITVPGGFVAGNFLADNTLAADHFPTIPEAAREVSRLAKAGVKNLRIRRMLGGKITNLKD